MAAFRLPRTDELDALVEDPGIDIMSYDKQWNRYRLRITQANITKHRDLLRGLTARSSGTA